MIGKRTFAVKGKEGPGTVLAVIRARAVPRQDRRGRGWLLCRVGADAAASSPPCAGPSSAAWRDRAGNLPASATSFRRSGGGSPCGAGATGGGRLLFRVDVRVCPTGLRVERGSREGLGSSARNRRSVTMSPSFCHLFCVGPGSMRAGERGWVRPSAPRVRTQAPPRRASARSGSGSLGEGTRPFPQETVEPRVEWRAQQACAHAVRYAFRARKGSARRDRRPRAFDRKE